MSNDVIHVITTGGSIDSEFNGVLDTVTTREVSVVPKFLSGIKLNRTFEFSDVCMKDSRMITQDDRNDILNAITESSIDKVLITHGTYTMPDTALYLQEHLGETDKTVVLTGSIVPLDGFTLTDAGFNLGFAIAQLDVLFAGVYLCINAQVVKANEALKMPQEDSKF